MPSYGMVLGIGTDLIEIERIEHSLKRFGARFLERIYTPLEISYCQRKRHGAAESLAARFAAKEAGAKALGTGISRGVQWTEIEVRNLPGGRPTILFHGRAAERAASLGVTAVHLSLTHSRGLAMAVVLVEGTPPVPKPVGLSLHASDHPAEGWNVNPIPTLRHP